MGFFDGNTIIGGTPCLSDDGIRRPTRLRRTARENVVGNSGSATN
jgi:hypothetical protein